MFLFSGSKSRERENSCCMLLFVHPAWKQRTCEFCHIKRLIALECFSLFMRLLHQCSKMSLDAAWLTHLTNLLQTSISECIAHSWALTDYHVWYGLFNSATGVPGSHKSLFTVVSKRAGRSNSFSNICRRINIRITFCIRTVLDIFNTRSLRGHCGIWTGGAGIPACQWSIRWCDPYSGALKAT